MIIIIFFTNKHKFWASKKKSLIETLLLHAQNMCYYRQLMK